MPSSIRISLALLLLASTLAAQEVETMPVSEIRPGDTGHGLSVFRGTRIERFDVEVIDVLPNALPGQPLVLIRCSQHGEDGYPLHESGIIGGMSGSPIYIDGKLIGALAYGWGFQKEPLAGVTPIANMLADARRPDERFGRAPSGSPWQGEAVRPVQTPMVVAGISPRLFDRVRRDFEAWGLSPLLGGGGGGAGGGGGDGEVRLEPGSAVAVTLMEGDMDFTAIGTVTHVTPEGQVLAFGHPFFQSGPVAWPMKTARIQTVIRSLSRSNKLGSGLETVGLLVKDRQAAVVGQLGREAAMIPLECVVKNRATGAAETYRAAVVDHPSLTPLLVNLALSNFAIASEPADDRTTVYATVSFAIAGLGEFEVADMFANGGASFDANMTAPIRMLYSNPYRRVGLESIRISLEVVHEDRTATIESLSLARHKVAPGETISGLARLRRFGDAPAAIVPFELEVPADAVAGPYELVVSGGNDVVPAYPAPESPEEIARWIRTWYRSSHLVARMQVPKLSLGHRGTKLSDLPASIVASLVEPNSTGDLSALVDEVRSARETEWVVLGKQSIPIVVVEKEPR